MALVVRKVTNLGDPLVGPDGTPVEGAKVTFTLVDEAGNPTDSWDTLTAERVAPVKESVYTASTDTPGGLQKGEFEVELWPNDRGTKLTYYKCEVCLSGVSTIIASVPSGAGALQWVDFKTNGEALSTGAYGDPLILTAGDTMPVTGVVTDSDGDAVSLTGYGLTLLVTDAVGVVVEIAATLLPLTLGGYSLDLSPLVVGRYSARMRVVSPVPATVTSEPFVIEVVA